MLIIFDVPGTVVKMLIFDQINSNINLNILIILNYFLFKLKYCCIFFLFLIFNWQFRQYFMKMIRIGKKSGDIDLEAEEEMGNHELIETTEF